MAAGTGTPRPLDGLRVLVTAGGTREPLDSVRYIGNRSSGRMGWALAAEAARRGARVTVIAANVSLPALPGIEYVDVETAEQLRADAGALRRLRRAADGRGGRRLPARPPARGQDRQGGHERLELELRADAGRAGRSWRPSAGGPARRVIGFAAEHGPEGAGRARDKLERKGLDAIV